MSAADSPCRVLIVDDSAVVRQVLTEILSQDPGIEVIGSAADPILETENLVKSYGQGEARFDALRGASDAWQKAHELFAELSRLGSPEATGDAIPRALARYRCDSEEGLQRLHRLLERQHYRVASWRTAADDINWRRFFDITELGGLPENAAAAAPVAGR